MSLLHISHSHPMLARRAPPGSMHSNVACYNSRKYTLRSSKSPSNITGRISNLSKAQGLESEIKFPPDVSPQFKHVTKVVFPAFSNLQCNMMPFRMGQMCSLPLKYHGYWDLLDACQIPNEELGKVGYLTISESFVEKDETQRRPGLHVEKHPAFRWGSWGDKAGLFMASNVDDTCRIWNCYVETPGPMGDCEHLRDQLKNPINLKSNQLVWLTDSCPHEAIPQKEAGMRQFFRVVTSRVDLWYKAHSTVNPLVPVPRGVRVIEENKFL